MWLLFPKASTETICKLQRAQKRKSSKQKHWNIVHVTSTVVNLCINNVLLFSPEIVYADAADDVFIYITLNIFPLQHNNFLCQNKVCLEEVFAALHSVTVSVNIGAGSRCSRGINLMVIKLFWNFGRFKRKLNFSDWAKFIVKFWK